MSFRPIGSGNRDANAAGDTAGAAAPATGPSSLPAKPSVAVAAGTSNSSNGEPAVSSQSSTAVQGPQIPAQLQSSSSSAPTATYNQQYHGYGSPYVGGGAAAAGPSYDTSQMYGSYAGPSTSAAGMNAGYDYAASGYAAYDGYSGYPAAAGGGAAGGYGYGASGYDYNAAAGVAGSYGTTDEELAAQRSAYTPDNAQQQQQKPKTVKGQARRTVLRKGAGEVWEDQTLMEWDPKHFRLFIGDLGNDVNDDDLVKAFGEEKGWKSFVKAKVIRDKVTNKTRGYGFVSYSDPEDFMAAWKANNGKYIGSRPVKIQKANTGVRQVDIGEKKAKELETKKKDRVIGNKVRGAVISSSWRPQIRR